MQYNKSITRLRRFTIRADRANHHKQVAKPIGSQFGGKPVGFVPRGFAEGGPQGEVFDGISGQCHFREYDDLRALLRGAADVSHDLTGVGVKISDAGVDLSECEANVCHSCLTYR